LDVEGCYPIAGPVELVLFIRNLLGEEYQERFGFPAAGRNIGVSLRTKF
jgi:outer membrane cobalamin receptor